MNIENIDKLAKQLVPESDVTNIWWWLSLLFLFIIGSFVIVFRDWLKANPDSDYLLPDDVINKTIDKYKEAYELLTGEKFSR